MSLLNGFLNKLKQENRPKVIEINKNIKKSNKDINLNNLVVYAPKNLNELNTAIDYLCKGQALILNLAGINKREFARIEDYLCGALYAIKAETFCLQNLLYVVVPSGVGLTTL